MPYVNKEKNEKEIDDISEIEAKTRLKWIIYRCYSDERESDGVKHSMECSDLCDTWGHDENCAMIFSLEIGGIAKGMYDKDGFYLDKKDKTNE